MSKGLEALKYVAKQLNSCPVNNNYLSVIEKELKALEIIKEKQVDIRMFILYDLENYNKLQKNDCCKLTKVEDDLLTEVVLDEKL